MKSIYSEAKTQLGNCVHEYEYNDCEPLPPSYESMEFPSNQSNCSKRNFNAATMPLTSAYETMQRPFKSDKYRGRWSSSVDFYFACTSHAFGTMAFYESPIYGFIHGGYFFLPVYLISLLIYEVPLFGIQTFLGQFSSSGTISAFRVAPLFKGIGYSILLLNLFCLSYSAVLTSVPLIYAAQALNSNIPWMNCQNSWNTADCSNHTDYDVNATMLDPHASVEFFRHIFLKNDDQTPYAISWEIVYALIGIWSLVIILLHKEVAFLGKFMRCSSILLLCMFTTVFFYIVSIKGLTWSELISYFDPIIPDKMMILQGILVGITTSTWRVGAGWGNILTLASHNHFRCDSQKMTYWIASTLTLVSTMTLIVGRLALDNFENEVGFFHYHVEENHNMQFLYICYAYMFGSLSAHANFWSFIFFITLFIAEFNSVIVQSMTVLTAIFDEYEKLRAKRLQITIGFVLIMMLISIFFTTKIGLNKLNILPSIGITTHVIITLILLFMITWIYGRDRFQCDLQFMLGKTINNFKIFLLRFVTPIFLLIIIYKINDLMLLEYGLSTLSLNLCMQLIVFSVALIYMAYKVSQTTGSLKNRLRQCFKPHDWHPVDADNRRFYEEIMGISEMLVIDNDQQSTAIA